MPKKAEKLKKSASKTEKKWAHSYLAAAKELGISARTLKSWVLEEGSPGRASNGGFNLVLWKAWARANKHRLETKNAGKAELPSLTRKQEIALELDEINLRKARREELEAENRMMDTESVDGLIFEVLANFDFHIQNAEREIITKIATAHKTSPREIGVIVKPCFDEFRKSFNEFPLSAEAKKNINAWLDLPEAAKASIMAGIIPAKGKK